MPDDEHDRYRTTHEKQFIHERTFRPHGMVRVLVDRVSRLTTSSILISERPTAALLLVACAVRPNATSADIPASTMSAVR